MGKPDTEPTQPTLIEPESEPMREVPQGGPPTDGSAPPDPPPPAPPA